MKKILTNKFFWVGLGSLNLYNYFLDMNGPYAILGIVAAVMCAYNVVLICDKENPSE